MQLKAPPRKFTWNPKIAPLEIVLFLKGHLKGSSCCTFNGIRLFDSFLGCRTAPQFCGAACHERRRGVVVGAAGG